MKHTVKIVIGWILVAFQALSYIARLASGTPFPEGFSGIVNFLGFSLFGIVGAILLIWGYSKKWKE